MESLATVNLIESTVKITKQQCLAACISQSSEFVGLEVIPTLKFLFSRDIDKKVIEVSANIVIRDAKSKTENWFIEHVPSIIDRDGKSAFERSRNRAILANQKTVLNG